MKRLTEHNYWESNYLGREVSTQAPLTGFSNHCNRLILRELLHAGLEGKRVLEIGAGNSFWLPYLATRFPTSQFAGLDYSEQGCHLLRQRAEKANVKVDIHCVDMFKPDLQLLGKFDLVLSFGVVEHFDDLGKTLAAMKAYLSDAGKIFTTIPNMAGLLGTLTNRFNPQVFQHHNPHDLTSFLDGHRKAGLNILGADYLGSTNFGVLSSCYGPRNDLKRQIGRVLMGVSVATWWVDQQIAELPSSKTFSPYIYALSQPA